MEKINLDKAGRGVETMFKITAGNHQRLSAMADNKAHIMISVNSIILSIVLSVLLKRIEAFPNFLIPVILLLTVNVTTLIFSVLATRPGIAFGVFTKKQVKHKEVNLLFFGNFHHIHLADYTNGMIGMMNDAEFLYKTLIKDMHSQGLVLSKKYHLLRIAYSVFMYGIVISVVAFIVAAVAF